MSENKQAILVVSFGTSYEDTRKKTIDQIEEEIRQAYPEYSVYRAWTSRMICRKILKRDGIHIPGVKEALEQMLSDGVERIIVQPTHVLNGIENDQMKRDILEFQDQFQKIAVGDPLLTSQADQEAVVRAVAENIQPGSQEALLLMGHGTEHFANAVYAALDYQFKDMGYHNIFMGTVEGYPTLDSVMKCVRKLEPQRILLAPFMIVAGDHAVNDLFGDGEDSWKSCLEAEGFSVKCISKGLGEYPQVRRLFLQHVEDAVFRMNLDR